MKINLFKIFFVISTILCITNRFWGIDIWIYLKYFVAIIWIFMMFIDLIKKNADISINNKIAQQLYLMILPLIVIFIYTLLIWVFKDINVSIRNFTRLCSTILYLIIAYLYALSGIHFFRKKTIDYIFISFCISYLFGSIIPFIINYHDGFENIFSAIIIQTDYNRQYLEVHDLTFAAGMLLLYYLLFDERKEINKLKYCFIATILVFLGFKRIEIFALIISIIFYYIFIKNFKINSKLYIIFIIFISLNCIFIYSNSAGTLKYLIDQFGINTSGRLNLYEFAANYYDFSLFYLGTGFTYFSKLFENLWLEGFRINGYVIPASIHSDILVMYIEFGFLFFILYFVYYFIMKPKIFYKSMGVKTVNCYLVMTSYVFIMYLSDNVSSYFSTQMIYFMIPIIVMISANKKFLIIQNRSKNDKNVI